MSTGEEETRRQPRQFGNMGVPSVADGFDAPLPEDELAVWEGSESTPSTDQAQRDAVATLAGAEHLDDLRKGVTGRHLAEALVRAGVRLDPDVEADIANALALDETAAITADPALMGAIREAEADVRVGPVVTASELIAAWRRGPEPSTQGWTRAQRCSLWLAAAVAGRVVADVAHAREIGRRNLATMRAAAGPRARTSDFAEWERLLDGPVDAMLAVLLGTSEHARDMRQHAPFAGLLDDIERRAILAGFREHDAAARGEAPPTNLAELLRMEEDVDLPLPARRDQGDDAVVADYAALLAEQAGQPYTRGIDLDAALVAVRAATDTGGRVPLDDVLAAFGYTRADLEDDSERLSWTDALEETGGPLTPAERAWADDVLDGAARRATPRRASWMAALSERERAAMLGEIAAILRAWRAAAEAYGSGIRPDQSNLTWTDEARADAVQARDENLNEEPEAW